ncbi:HD domain-containing protein [Limibaculum sp. M0105]|uniref:HD domain-containing protein n=1 Tax=Thermohalobaculum xanthum TaxID=2753746 RepID=A0A8J7M8E0_9RHOB|nr:HD domain-containing protein [Thermohalobaculum xanthum]
MTLVARACHQAAVWHADQRRKGERAEPYVNHLTEVAALVAEATDGGDPNLIAAALLHDAIEDAGVSHAQIEAAFNRDVADLVAEVTDDKSLEKAERKRLQVEHAPAKSPRAKMIKLADKTSNLRAILASPPAGWNVARKREYLDWAGRVVAGARGTNARLEAAYDEAAAALAGALDGVLDSALDGAREGELPNE